MSELCKLPNTLKTLNHSELDFVLLASIVLHMKTLLWVAKQLTYKQKFDLRFAAKTKFRKFFTFRHAMQCIAKCSMKINQNREMLSKRLSEKFSLRFVL